MYRLSWNLGISTFCNPLGLSRPLMGLLYLYSVPRSAIGPSPESIILAISFLSVLRVCCFPVIWLLLSQIKGKFVLDNTMKSYRGRRDITPHILNLGNRCGQIYALDALFPEIEPSMTPPPVTTFWKRGKVPVPAGIRAPDHPVCYIVSVPTWLPRLSTYAEWSLTFMCNLRFAG
jgi:hypothetical protein